MEETLEQLENVCMQRKKRRVKYGETRNHYPPPVRPRFRAGRLALDGSPELATVGDISGPAAFLLSVALLIRGVLFDEEEGPAERGGAVGVCAEAGVEASRGDEESPTPCCNCLICCC